MRQDHPIFNTPHKIDLTFEESTTPSGYRKYPEGRALSETMQMWKVQTCDFGSPWIDPGLVSTPYGFEDSPDAEFISSGVNSKGPNSVALGRVANQFLWGFFAPPSMLTDEAKLAFVNAICYIDRFDGEKPLVQIEASAREWALVYPGYIDLMGEQALDFLPRVVGQDLVDELGIDSERYSEYFQQNFEYLHRGKDRSQLLVDEDARSLGLSNRSLDLIDKCISMLAADDQTELAQRLLERYTRENFTSHKQWQKWLDTNRDRLFFTDAGGYRWIVGPAE